MTTQFSRSAAALALAASLSMAATPVLAAALPSARPAPAAAVQGVLADAPAKDVANGHRGGWGGGWNRGWRGHRDRGIDGGDVLAGILVIGGIAAIASAANRSQQERREREAGYPDARYPDRDSRDDYRRGSAGYGYDRGGADARYAASRGMESAVDSCVDEVQRSDRDVYSVDEVGREGDGWRVTGRTVNDRPFDCSVDRDGRISRVTVDGRAR